MAVATAALSPPRSPTNIPADRTSFVGRAAELVRMTQALDPMRTWALVC